MKINKLYNYLFILFILGTHTGMLSAQEAEFIKLSKDFILHEDGSQELRCYKELKLFTHTAMNSTYGETFVIYNPDFQELKIHSCYTKQKDGTIIQAPENAFVEVLPRFAADAPAYNQLKEMVIVHTGLDLGSTIFLDYSVLTKAGYYPELDIDELLQESSPIRNYTISVSVPENKTLNSILYASTQKAAIQMADGLRKQLWQLNNIPASSRMPFLPQNKENIPRLVANTYTSQAQALSFLQKQSEASVSLESETYAQFITEECATAQEKIETIHNYVANNISTIKIPLQYNGFRFRGADESIRSAYGTEIEKANLLCKMLKAINIPAEMIVWYPATIQSPTLGLTPVKQVGVKITADGKTQYLSATSKTHIKPELRGALDNLFTLEGNSQKIETQPAVYKQEKEITLDTSSAKNGYLVYDLPPTAGIDSWNITTLNSRRTDLFEIPSGIQDKISYTITVPEGVSLRNAKSIEISTPQGKVSRTIRTEGTQIEVVRYIELNKQQYTPQEYSEVRNLINEWNSNTNKQLLFKVN
jgi:Transglutaminase-like superfamily.